MAQPYAQQDGWNNGIAGVSLAYELERSLSVLRKQGHGVGGTRPAKGNDKYTVL